MSTTFQKTLAGSVGAGMGSLFNAGGKKYYILEHKVSSRYHRAGEAQEIIVDEIELGRDSSCAVQFDESFKTVSRHHAAIVRDGDNWKLVQLSKTNTTFLNGHPVKNEWYLQNGDEIQLSVNGPKLGFIIPSGARSTVGTIGLSRRLSLFRQQALRPYKRAMWTMALCLLLVIGAGVGYGIFAHKQVVEMGKASEQQLMAANERHQQEMQEMQQANMQLQNNLKHTQGQVKSLDQQLKSLKSGNTVAAVPAVSSAANSPTAAYEPNVYFLQIRITLSLNGETETRNIGSGTGFLLSDGRFVTARHVVEPWAFIQSPDEEVLLLANIVKNNGGEAVTYIDAYSPTGKQFTVNSKQFTVNRSSDKSFDYNGYTISVQQNLALDWAYCNIGDSNGLQYHNALSSSLPQQAKLTILGYPHHLGANSPSDIQPLYSEAVVAKQGLDNGRIVTTATTFEQGNSGGPVFATTEDGNLVVVGLVTAGIGRSTGFVVPISAVK